MTALTDSFAGGQPMYDTIPHVVNSARWKDKRGMIKAFGTLSEVDQMIQGSPIVVDVFGSMRRLQACQRVMCPCHK